MDSAALQQPPTPDSPPVETIIELAPPYFGLPVSGYGGTERVIWSLSVELSKQAVQDPTLARVELWAPGDSAQIASGTRLKLVSTVPTALGLHQPFRSMNQLGDDMYRLRERLESDAQAVGHIHVEDEGFKVFGDAAKTVSVRILTTMHNLPKWWAARYFSHMPVIAISHAQAAGIRGFKFLKVIHNGIDPDLFHPTYDLRSDAPFAFLGRFCPNKNPVDAVEIARACGARIEVAGISDKDAEDYARRLDVLIAQGVGWAKRVGEVSDVFDARLGQSSKSAFLGNSRALLFPIQWPEPFGLVIAEANATGTPVIAYNHPGSSVDELIKDGVNGYKVTSRDEAVQAARAIHKLDRRRVREYFERHFTVKTMAEAYRRVLCDDLPQYWKDEGLK